MVPSKLTLILFLATGVLTSGCQSQLSRVKGDNTRLSEQVSKLRADKRREEREQRELRNQLAQAQRGDAPATPTKAAARQGAPELPVEVLGPSSAAQPFGDTLGGSIAFDDNAPFVERHYDDGTRVVGVTEDGTEIIYADAAASGEVGVWTEGGWDGTDTDFTAEPEPEPVVARPAKVRPIKTRPADPNAVYRAAVSSLLAGEHVTAIDALRAFIQTYPSNGLADNAQYWLGEAFYDQKDYAQALVEFQTTVSEFPRGNKVPDALLKVGYTYLALGEPAKARVALERVASGFPTSEPGKLAIKRLEMINR